MCRCRRWLFLLLGAGSLFCASSDARGITPEVHLREATGVERTGSITQVNNGTLHLRQTAGSGEVLHEIHLTHVVEIRILEAMDRISALDRHELFEFAKPFLDKLPSAQLSTFDLLPSHYCAEREFPEALACIALLRRAQTLKGTTAHDRDFVIEEMIAAYETGLQARALRIATDQLQAHPLGPDHVSCRRIAAQICLKEGHAEEALRMLIVPLLIESANGLSPTELAQLRDLAMQALTQLELSPDSKPQCLEK